MSSPLLGVSELSVSFAGAGRAALDGVAFHVERGERVALVGESGAGKTVTALAIAGLLPASASVRGNIRLEGASLSAQEPPGRRVAGKKVGMVFQDPRSTVNPVRTLGSQLMEVIREHGSSTKSAARAEAHELLSRVGLSDPKRCFRQYPHELSGGMLQRVGIALALASNPELLIADEPTTALDPTLRNEILRLLAQECGSRSLALLLITHDLEVAAEFTTRMLVLYRGRIVESGPTRALFASPAHPYTRALLAARPGSRGRGARLSVLQRTPGRQRAEACSFAADCPNYFEPCEQAPPFQQVAPGRSRSCWQP